MGCFISKDLKVAGIFSPNKISINSEPLALKVPNDISKKELSILPVKSEEPFNGHYFRD
jgi:hypothetical protein